MRHSGSKTVRIGGFNPANDDQTGTIVLIRRGRESLSVCRLQLFLESLNR
jgi:hypothetical protein